MAKRPEISFEFFPPRTQEGREKLKNVREQLNAYAPEYYSVTYGAGGSTRDNTRGVVMEIHAENLAVAPHLSVGNDDSAMIEALLKDYQDAGIKRLVALRGDLPSGLGHGRRIYANELVEFIREKFADHFHIAVAVYPEIHPESDSYQSDIRWLKAKFAAGANAGITQYFYNPDAYLHYRDQCLKAGIDQPLVPGIMPISNYKNLARFSDNCGAEIPRWVRKRLESFGDDIEGLRSFGLDVVTELCEVLLKEEAPGLHFYTMNQAEAVSAIIDRLGIAEKP